MRFNTTVTNISPLLLFLPSALWREESNALDVPLTSNTSSYHTCNATFSNPGVSFSWNGTGIWIYGDRQPQNSPFRVTLDGNSQSYSTSGQDGLLFSAVNLQPIAHRIAITNIGSGIVDDPSPQRLDFKHLIFETSAQDVSTVNSTIPSSSEQFQYYPESSGFWTGSSDDIRSTSCSSSGVRINFSGSVISVYGTVAGNQGGFSASLDGGAWQRYTPNSQIINTTSQLLYFWSGATVNNHTLVIQNDPSGDSSESCSGSENVLSIAHASVYFSNTSLPNSGSDHQNGLPSSGSRSKHIVVVISTCAGAIATFLIGWVIRRWYLKHNKDLKEAHHIQAPRPYPKEEPYNPPGIPATEIVEIVVVSRLSEDGVRDISPTNYSPFEDNYYRDTVLDISRANIPPPEPGEDVINASRAPDNHPADHLEIEDNRVPYSGLGLVKEPLRFALTPVTTLSSSNELSATFRSPVSTEPTVAVTIPKRQGRPLPSRPERRRTITSFQGTYAMSPPPYYNVSL